jgi:hypothetical protein
LYEAGNGCPVIISRLFLLDAPAGSCFRTTREPYLM